MGTVYLARLEGMGGFQRLFAVKVLHPHLVREKAFVAMLLDEARLAARLHHPNAVGIVDVGEGPLGPYVVMEYVDGFTLEDILDRAPTPRERARLGIRLLLDAAKGLHAAHRLEDDHGNPLGIVHRDVSPQNVLVGADGIGRIADFGVARAAARITASRPGTVKGKPCYMAPEQAKGADDLDARADTFALGIMLWEILVGRSLFQADADMVTLMAVVTKPIEAPASVADEIPEAIDQVTMKALERDREGRYQSARELTKALEAAARQAGWLASSDEVADFIEQAFGEDLEERRAAVRGHLDSLRGSVAVPIVGSDVFAVPRLASAPDIARTSMGTKREGPWHETPAGSERIDPTGPTVSGLRSAPDLQPPSSIPALEPEKTRRVATLLGLLGLLMLGLAAWLLFGRESAPVAEPAAEEAPAAPLAEPEPPMAVEQEPVAGSPVPEAVEDPTVEPTSAEEAAITEDPASAPTSAASRGRRARRATRMQATMSAEPATPSSPGTPIEANPYLR